MLVVRCIKDGLDEIEKGQELRVSYIENRQYHFNEEDYKTDKEGYNPEDFEIVRADKYMYHGKSNPMYFMDGEEYIVLDIEKDGILHVVDETGDDYMYSPASFTEAPLDGKD